MALLLSQPWNDATKLSVLSCFIYCTIAIILQSIMIITFIWKVICKSKSDPNTSINNRLIYLCLIVLSAYFITTCNDMVCIIVYALTLDPQQLQFYHTFISLEWNVAIMLQFLFFLYRLRLITTQKYRSKCTNPVFAILCIIQIAARIITYFIFSCK